MRAQIKKMDTSSMTEQQLAKWQRMGCTLYEGPAENENLFDGTENDYSDTDSDVSSIWSSPEEPTIDDADSSLENDSWGTLQVEDALPTDNDDAWGSTEVKSAPHTKVEESILASQDIKNAPNLNTSPFDIPWDQWITEREPVKVTDRTYRETDITYNWNGTWYYEVYNDTSITRVSTADKDFCSGDWPAEMQGDYSDYKRMSHCIPSCGRTFDSAKAAFDAGVLAVKARADFMNKYPRAFGHGGRDHVSNHLQAVTYAVTEVDRVRDVALDLWRLEHPNERGESWLYTPLITEAITGPKVESMRPEEYMADCEEMNALKRKAREEHVANDWVRLPEYAIDGDRPALKRPSVFKCWCLRRCWCVFQALNNTWAWVGEAWEKCMEPVKAVLPVHEPLPVVKEFEW